MAFSIQTNVNSLIAQENLRVNSNFQNQTIQRLTSGYRINSSGDDAAGLAIANKFRSDTAELSQGVRNANDGVAQLQIMDGGMNNIGKMLDRLKTLATQSASATFTGDRTVLNSEYQNLVTEIDRQAQSVGLSTGGHFAAKMGVYLGGGTTAGGGADTSNGTVSLDLTNSVVDSKSLGLRTSEFSAQTATGVNLASASNTSIANIVNANSGDSGTASFQLSGAGFSGVAVKVTVTTADTTSTLADKLNSAIQAAGNSGTANGNNLRAAGVSAKAVTDSTGNQQIAFVSSTGAFQVTASNNTANALFGKFDASSQVSGTGASVKQTVTASSAVSTAAPTTKELVRLTVTVNGTANTITAKIDTADTGAADILGDVTGGTGYSAISALGVTAQLNTTTGKLEFVGNSNQTIEVSVAGDTSNYLGLGAWKDGVQVLGHQDVAIGAAAGRAIQVTVNSTVVDLTGINIVATDTRADILTKIQNTGNYGDLQKMGVEAQLIGNRLAFVGNSGQTVSISSITDGSDALGLGSTGTPNTTVTTELLTAGMKTLSGHDVSGSAAITTGTGQAVSFDLTVDNVTRSFSYNIQAGDAATDIITGLTTGANAANYSALTGAGVTISQSTGTLKFLGNNGQEITVGNVTDAANLLKLSAAASTARTGYTTLANAGASGDKATVAFSVNGGDKILVSFTSTGTASTTAQAFQAAIDANAELKAAGLTVDTATLAISAQGSSNSNRVPFRAYVESQSGTLNLGLGTASSVAASFSATGKAAMLTAGGASQTGVGNNNDVFSFSGLKNKGGAAGVAGALADQQVLSFGATDAAGTAQSYSVTLNSSNADDVDSAVSAINTQLQNSGNATLKNITAVKETNAAGTAEGIRFISSLNSFSVQVGTTNNTTSSVQVGLYDGTAGSTSKQGMTVQSGSSGAIDISTMAGAQKAVVTLGDAVKKLGSAQAAIGKGQNQLNYAIGLAQSQISNFSAAESRIRDADIASEAANLTKAQVLQQASMAAMAQANSAPQAVLALLRG